MIIPTRVFGIARCASMDGIRPNMGGINFERDDQGRPVAVATNGKVMAVVSWDEPDENESRLTIPDDLLQREYVDWKPCVPKEEPERTIKFARWSLETAFDALKAVIFDWFDDEDFRHTIEVRLPKNPNSPVCMRAIDEYSNVVCSVYVMPIVTEEP